MKKNIGLILYLSFFLSTLNGQISFLQDHIIKWQNGLKYTEDVMNTLPDSLWNFKPVKEEMSFREQVSHITQNMYWLSSTYLNGESLGLKIKDEGQSIQEIKDQYLEIGKYTLGVLRNLKENDLSERVIFFAGNLTRLQIFELMHDHHTHHRGQMIVYLRLNGFKPPKYVGW
jgi:uncharacterized damage-inducible protein DinB